jgi:hypothetical protein
MFLGRFLQLSAVGVLSKSTIAIPHPLLNSSTSDEYSFLALFSVAPSLLLDAVKPFALAQFGNAGGACVTDSDCGTTGGDPIYEEQIHCKDGICGARDAPCRYYSDFSGSTFACESGKYFRTFRLASGL